MRRLARPAIAAAVLVLGLAAPSRAGITVTMTDTNSIKGLVASTSFTDAGTPGLASFGGPSFGNFVLESLSVTANYDGSVLPNPGTAKVQDIDISAHDEAKAGVDTLSISVTTSPYSIPGGSPLVLNSGETSSFLDKGASSKFVSSLVSGPDTTTTAPALITGAGFVLQTAPSPAIEAPNHFPPFALDNSLTITMAGGETGNINGTTTVSAVPEPATMVMLLSGLPLMGLGYWARRRRRG
jgi:hypothetical protein